MMKPFVMTSLVRHSERGSVVSDCLVIFLRPLPWVENIFSAALFIWSYRFVTVQSIRLSTHPHVRLGLPLPSLPSSISSIVLSGVSQCPGAFLIAWPA